MWMLTQKPQERQPAQAVIVSGQPRQTVLDWVPRGRGTEHWLVATLRVGDVERTLHGIPECLEGILAMQWSRHRRDHFSGAGHCPPPLMQVYARVSEWWAPLS